MAQRRLLSLYLRYLSSLNESPLLTKSGTCGVLGLLEEFSSQALTFENGRNFVWGKMLKMGAYGALINAPLSHFLYDLLNQVVGSLVSCCFFIFCLFNLTELARVPRFQSLVQLALSNLVVLPLQTYVYLASMGLLVNDLSWGETLEVIKTNFLPIMITRQALCLASAIC
jgi:hypothetical protein